MRKVPVLIAPKLLLVLIAAIILIVTALWLHIGYTTGVVVLTSGLAPILLYLFIAGAYSLQNACGSHALYVITRDSDHAASIHTMWIKGSPGGEALVSEALAVILYFSRELAGLGVKFVDVKSPMFIGPNLGYLRAAAHSRFGEAAVSTAPNKLDLSKRCFASMWSWLAARRAGRGRSKLRIKTRAPGVRVTL